MKSIELAIMQSGLSTGLDLPAKVRTHAQLDAVLRKVIFCGLLRPMSPVLRRRHSASGSLGVRLVVQAPDRDSHKIGPVRSDIFVAPGIRTDDLLGRLRHQIGRLMLHEVDEGILFDGVRIFDPHRERP